MRLKILFLACISSLLTACADDFDDGDDGVKPTPVTSKVDIVGYFQGFCYDHLNDAGMITGGGCYWITFNENGSYRRAFGGGQVDGSYTLDDKGTVTLQDSACNADGVYTATRKEGNARTQLELKLVDDKCVERAQTLSYPFWLK